MYIHTCISIYQPIYVSVYLFIYLYQSMSIYLSVCLSIYLSNLTIYMCPSIYLCLPIYVHIYEYTYMMRCMRLLSLEMEGAKLPPGPTRAVPRDEDRAVRHAESAPPIHIPPKSRQLPVMEAYMSPKLAMQS